VPPIPEIVVKIDDLFNTSYLSALDDDDAMATWTDRQGWGKTSCLATPEFPSLLLL
jgi:hypothetical protein